MPNLYCGPPGGFTLSETLAVIAVVAILAALLVPAVRKAQDSTQGARCAGNLRQIGAGIGLYVADNDGKFPTRGPGDPGSRSGLPHWAIAAYLYPSRFAANDFAVTHDEVFRCPSWDSAKDSSGASYTASMYLRPVGQNSGQAPDGLRYLQLQNKSRLLIWTECHTNPLYQPTLPTTFNRLAARHNGRLNVLFGDFHVESFTKEEITGANPAVEWDWR